MLQNFVEDFKICDTKECTKSKWPTQQVPRDPPQNRPVPSASRSVPANSGSRRLAREMRKLRLLYRICMCHLASQRLADTDTWCILSLWYRIRGFCLTPLPPSLVNVQILQYTLVKHLLNTLGLGSVPEAAGILGNVFTCMCDVSRL